MNLMSRLLSCFVLLIALLASISAERLMDLWTLHDANGHTISLFQIIQNREELMQQMHMSQQHSAEKDRIAAALMAGEMTLEEVALDLRSLFEETKSWKNPVRPRPHHDDGPAWCREVIAWTIARYRWECSACQCELLRKRLEDEYKKLQDESGGINLPD